MFRTDVSEALRAQGHDVIRADECGQAREGDDLLLMRAIAELRVLITLDEHFGDWSVLPLEKHPGVIRLKVHPTLSANVFRTLIPFLHANKERDFRNCLVIVSEDKVRWIRTAE